MDFQLLEYESLLSNEMYGNINFKQPIFGIDGLIYHEINDDIKQYAATNRLTYQIVRFNEYDSKLFQFSDAKQWKICKNKQNNDLILHVKYEGSFYIVTDITDQLLWISKYEWTNQEPTSKRYCYVRGYVRGFYHQLCKQLNSIVLFKGIYNKSLVKSPQIKSEYVWIDSFNITDSKGMKADVFKKLGQCEENRLIFIPYHHKIIVYQMHFKNIQLHSKWLNSENYNDFDAQPQYIVSSRVFYRSNCRRIKQKNSKY